MILGNVAYRGSLRRRSVVTTAGSLMFTVSKPPSISRVTVKPSPVFSSLDANVAYKKTWWQLIKVALDCSYFLKLFNQISYCFHFLISDMQDPITLNWKLLALCESTVQLCTRSAVILNFWLLDPKIWSICLSHKMHHYCKIGENPSSTFQDNALTIPCTHETTEVNTTNSADEIKQRRKPTWGQSKNEAVIWPVWLLSLSIAYKHQTLPSSTSVLVCLTASMWTSNKCMHSKITSTAVQQCWQRWIILPPNSFKSSA